jgi:hypothetical protein
LYTYYVDVSHSFVLDYYMLWLDLFVTLREERRLRMSEIRVLRKICGSKTDKVTGTSRPLHSKELHDLYCSLNVIGVMK